MYPQESGACSLAWAHQRVHRSKKRRGALVKLLVAPLVGKAAALPFVPLGVLLAELLAALLAVRLQKFLAALPNL